MTSTKLFLRLDGQLESHEVKMRNDFRMQAFDWNTSNLISPANGKINYFFEIFLGQFVGKLFNFRLYLKKCLKKMLTLYRKHFNMSHQPKPNLYRKTQ